MNTRVPSIEEIRSLLREGRRDDARSLLDARLRSNPQDPESLYLRGMLHAGAGANLAALADFDAALQLAPQVPPVLFNRGLVLFRLERLPEALEDFLALGRIDPGNPEVWTNIGIIHARQGRPAEAIESLEVAGRLAPDSPVILRTKANALRDMERIGDSLDLLRQVMALTPDDPEALTDYALALLSAGDFAQARGCYRRALALDPGDQTALAGLYMASIASGQIQAAQQLMDYTRLLATRKAPGIEDLDSGALREAVLAHPELRWEPAGRSTRRGQQSTMLDLGPDGPFARFGSMLEQTVRERLATLAADQSLASHPWMRSFPRRWRLQAWATVLHQGGNQSPHIHPAGWMSGVFYLDIGQPQSEHAGHLVFGHPPPDVRIDATPHESVLRPQDGLVACFPSYFLHHTTPYDGPDNPRISLAFDVIPGSG